MSDYEGGLPIKTVRDNDVSLKIVDGASGTSATKKLSIASVGDAVAAGVNDFGVPVLAKDAAGNYVLLNIGANGLKTELHDAAGNQLTFVADGQVVGSDKGLLFLGTDGVNYQVTSMDTSGRINVNIELAQGVDGTAAPAQTLQIGGKDAAGNLQTLKTDNAGNILAAIVPSSNLAYVCDYQTTATLGTGAVTTHDYVITTAKLLKGLKILVGARGASKVRVGTYNGTVFTPKFTFFQQIQGNIDHDVQCLMATGDGTLKIRVEITNTDGQSSDVYSTFQGTEE